MQQTPTPRTSCRFCGTLLRHTIIDLGAQPPCSSIVSLERFNEAELFYPLRAMVCHCCYLVHFFIDLATY